jgi:hypothetical protein
MPECAINDCDRKSRTRGWCPTHYQRWRTTGDPLGSKIPDHPDRSGEQWRTLPEWEGYYEVSNRGRVRSLDRTITYVTGTTQRRKGTVLRAATTEHGRHTVHLARHGETRMSYVAHLVAAAFIGPRPPGLEVCHGDGDCSNDAPDNLRYDTSANNHLDTVRHGTHWQTRKTHCPADHLLQAPNLQPSSLRLKLKARKCLACARARQNVRYAKQIGRPYDLRALADDHYARIMADA